jgi:hypothetical protein
LAVLLFKDGKKNAKHEAAVDGSSETLEGRTPSMYKVENDGTAIWVKSVPCLSTGECDQLYSYIYAEIGAEDTSW